MWWRLDSSLLILSFLLLASCSADQSERGTAKVPGSSGALKTSTAAAGSLSRGEWFVEQAETTGLDFVHVNGMSGKAYMPEIMGPGVGLLDYDNDGDLDVYFVQGQMLGAGQPGDPAGPRPGNPLRLGAPLGGRLYRNDLTVHENGTRTLHFTDVTDQSGINAGGYGMGVATGDFNNDGCVDLYLTNLGSNQLFANHCDGTFSDVSRLSRTDDAGWSVSASFVDYDRDGWLDLFVGHYLNYSVKADKTCNSVTGRRNYCPPQVYSPQRNRLYHNNRDGTFADVSEAAGIAGASGPTLGVVAADFNNDGWIDLYVANDGQENQLWINQKGGTFKNTALASGTALTGDGKAEASMGVDAGDFDNDGDEDLFVTEKTGEGFNFYVNNGSGMFEDWSARTGLGRASLAYTGFGTAWLDFDNDGWLDLLSVNGTIQALEGRESTVFPYDQRKLLFRNLRIGRFEDVSSLAGAAFQSSDVGRGAAFGDIDNNGDIDVLVGNDAGRAQLLVNNLDSHGHWIGLRLIGEQTPRDMLGARVAVIRKDGSTLWRRARADGSYASANDPRVLVGLGDSTEAPRVRVQWPSGRADEWTTLAIDRYTTLKEGSGR